MRTSSKAGYLVFSLIFFKDTSRDKMLDTGTKWGITIGLGCCSEACERLSLAHLHMRVQ
jgi:hypothetical protein